MQAITEQRKAFLGFFCTVVFVVLVGSLLQTKKFQAIALIQLMPRAGQEMAANEVVNNDAAGYLEGRDRARTQIQIILSRSVSSEVLTRYAALGNTDIPATDDGIDAFRRTLSAAPREDTQLVEIGVLHTDPEKAAVLANLVAEVYQQSNLEARTDAARTTQAWLDKQTTGSHTELAEATEKALAFKKENNLVDIDQGTDGISTRMSALQTSLGDATSKRVLLESKVSEHRQLLAKRDFDVLAGMFADPGLQTMAQERARVKTESAEVLAQYGTQHPEHQRAVGRIQQIEDLIAAEVERNIEGERSEVDTLRRQEVALTKELDEVKAELAERQRLQGQYSELKLAEDRARRVYEGLGERGADVGLQANSRLNDVRILDRAVPPKRAASPNIPLNLAMAIVVGVGGGLGLALVLNRLNDTIMSPGDVERYLDTPLLGTILSLSASSKTVAQRAMHSFDHPRSMSAESLRSIRAVLQTFPPNGRSRRLLVTSCIEGEGKTHVAIGVAVTFAQLGQSVLLVDADLRLPQLHKLLGTSETPGLSEALIDSEANEPFVLRTRVPRLCLLPRGSAVDYPNELLASPQVEKVLSRLATMFDVVIIDTPPAAVVADALSLARQADGVILVVRRGRVNRALVTKTLAQLRTMGARILGVALNDVPRGKDAASHYYDETARTDQRAQT